MSTSFDPVVSPAVIAGALKTIGAADAKLTKVKATIAAEQSKAFNMVLDAMFVACDKPKAVFLKGNAATNPARAQVKAMFDQTVEAGYLTKATAATYQTCFWIAFEQGIQWSADLANAKTKAKQNAAADGVMPKAGSSTQTTRAELDKTLSKALAQARAIGLVDFAADMLDLIQDRLDNFTETVMAKK